MSLRFPHKVVVAPTHREAFRLRAELLGLEAVADRAAPPDTDFVVTHVVEVLGGRLRGNALDIGAGNGVFLRLAGSSSQTASLVGLDLAVTSLRTLKDDVGLVFSPVAGTCERLPFAAGYFSTVVMNSVLFLLGSYADAEAAISEVHRVLAPGGTAYFGEIPTSTEQRLVAPRSFASRVVAKVKRGGMAGLVREVWRHWKEPVYIVAPDTMLYWDRDRFIKVLEETGFRVLYDEIHQTRGGPSSRRNYMVEKC